MRIRLIALIVLVGALTGCRSVALRRSRNIGERVEVIASALKLYQADHGALPDSLNHLVPTYLDADVLWLDELEVSYPRGSFLFYAPHGVQLGGSSVVAFTPVEVPTGGRYVIHGPGELQLLHWGEGAFQEWLAGDKDF